MGTILRQLYRQLIYDSLSAGAIEELGFYSGEVVDLSWFLHHFEFDLSHLLGFLDDFCIQTAHSGNSSSQGQQFTPEYEREFYSGYLRKHSLKAQIVCLPIGVIGSVFNKMTMWFKNQITKQLLVRITLWDIHWRAFSSSSL